MNHPPSQLGERAGAVTSSSSEGLSPQSALDAATTRRRRYAYMYLSRTLDARFESLRLSGRVAKWYSAIGNEAVTVPAGQWLDSRDVLCSLHRDLGAILCYYLDCARTFPECDFGRGAAVARPQLPEPEDLLERLCRQLLGRGGGFSEGIERSYHYGLLSPEDGLRHVGMISHLGSMIPVAAGCALAVAREGRGGVAINFIGDGGTSTGDFHEALNIAAVWDLPLILVIENNRYAFSTPISQQYRADRLSDRGLGYGIKATTIDGNDPDVVDQTFAEAFEHARSGAGPVLIEAMVGRMRGHAEGDDSLKVVPREELDRYLDEDPVPRYAERLGRDGVMDERQRRQIESRAETLIETALDRALAAPQPDLKVARRPALASLAHPRSNVRTSEPPIVTEISYVDAICRAQLHEMESDDTVLLMGQDIAAFEGPFRSTKGLFERWPDRVIDTPIAESGTVGAAIGAALMGLRPVIEIQFADFVSCAFNQLVNVAAKLFYRWEAPCPLVIRLPAGGGVGAAPFHSQNPEGWFAHIAGLKVVCPATAADAYGLLRASIQDPNPVIFCEHKYLYRRIKGVLDDDAERTLGKAAVRRSGSDLTLIAYGADVWRCLDAAERLATLGVEAEVVDLRTLVPLDTESVLESVKKTGRAMVVHEAQITAGFGAEVAAVVAEQAFSWLDAPVRRIAYPDRPVPYAKVLERELLPNVEGIVDAARELMAY